MDSKAAGVLLGIAGLAAAVWFLWSNQGPPPVSLSENAFSDISYSPYAHWAIQRDAGFVRNYPDRVAPNCLPEAIAEESSTLTMAMQGLDSAVEAGAKSYD